MVGNKSLLEDSNLFEELDNENAATYVGGRSLNSQNFLNLMTNAGATWDNRSTDADSLAIAHSKRMCNNGNLDHKGFGDRARRLGLPAAENVAYAKTDRQAFNGWMNSPGHKANMLNPAYDNVGVGIWQCPNGYNYYTAIFHS